MDSHDLPPAGTPPAQLNAELRNAHLELLAAHCATHQLRAHYSTEHLARMGEPDVLRKSAEAAAALHEFYSAIASKISPPPPAPERLPQLTAEQIAQGVEAVCSSLRAQREQYLPQGRPLSRQQKAALKPYFPASLLKRLRIAELHGTRVAVPEFYSKARAMGVQNLPELSHMESITFLDVIVFNETFTDRGLFHGMVHSVQIEVLGLERYAELWVHGFLKSHAHFTVPLEVQAFSLASKFLRPVPERFSVEKEVRQWAAEGRY
jgi:hypothetical protein